MRKVGGSTTPTKRDQVTDGARLAATERRPLRPYEGLLSATVGPAIPPIGVIGYRPSLRV